MFGDILMNLYIIFIDFFLLIFKQFTFMFKRLCLLVKRMEGDLGLYNLQVLKLYFLALRCPEHPPTLAPCGWCSLAWDPSG